MKAQARGWSSIRHDREVRPGEGRFRPGVYLSFWMNLRFLD
jgi:hypothetical protein